MEGANKARNNGEAMGLVGVRLTEWEGTPPVPKVARREYIGAEEPWAFSMVLEACGFACSSSRRIRP